MMTVFQNDTRLNALGCCCNKEATAINYKRGDDYGLVPTALGSYGKQINWDTAPVINTYIYNRDGFWDCNDWMTWHQKLAARWGKERANEVFMIWWNKQDGLFDYAYNNCMPFNQAFRTYFKSVGLSLDKLTEIVMAPLDIASDAVDISKQIVKNTGDTITATSSVLKTIIPWGLGLAAVGVGFYIYKNYIKGDSRVKVGTSTI